MLDAAGSGAEKDISDDAVSVRAHGDEVAAFLFDPLDDFLGGFSVGEFRADGDSGGFKFRTPGSGRRYPQ